MRLTILIGCFLLVQVMRGQNLVPNHSFEGYTSCPQYNGDLFCAPWFSPNDNTPDYLNECWNGWWYDSQDVPINRWGSEPAHTGAAYTAIATLSSSANAREYISIKLVDTLRAGKTYNVEFYATLGDSSMGGTSHLGVHFSSTPDTMYVGFNISYLPFVPQIEFDTVITDTANWVKMRGSFVANGDECYMTIGLFRPDSSIEYKVIQGDSSFPYTYYFIDDVSVTQYYPPTYPEITLFPNPSNGNFTITGNFPAGSELKIYNVLGQQVSRTIPLPEGNNAVPFLAFLAQGTYIGRIESEGTLVETLKIVVSE